ncbi:MAG: hypothetical protein AAF146_17950 [Bacteroidota bacterium]
MRKWLQSPIHNQREDVVQLLDYLVEGSRLNKEDLLEKQVVFPWIGSGQNRVRRGRHCSGRCG